MNKAEIIAFFKAKKELFNQNFNILKIGLFKNIR